MIKSQRSYKVFVGGKGLCINNVSQTGGRRVAQKLIYTNKGEGWGVPKNYWLVTNLRGGFLMGPLEIKYAIFCLTPPLPS